MEYHILICALVTLILPVLIRSLRIQTGRFKGWLNGWGILFLAAAIITGYGSIQAIRKSQEEAKESLNRMKKVLNTIRTESLRLRQDDFQVRLISFSSSGERGRKTEPAPIHCKARVGDELSMMFEFVGLNAPWKIGSGRGGGGRWGYRFYASNITIGGLEDHPYLQDLNGKEFYMKIPLKQLEFMSGYWSHHVDLYVKGIHFSGKPDEKGEVSIVLEFPEKKSAKDSDFNE